MGDAAVARDDNRLAGVAPAAAPSPGRNPAIDRLRGIVMILMVLDHARDFFHGVRADPTDLDTTTPLFFATRWVTHFCAPVFVFLAGTAAYLYGQKHSRGEQFRFLLSRGLFLVVLEVTVVRFGIVPEPGYHFTLLQVIWAIGWSMVFLALLSRLPFAAAAAVGLAIVLGHNLLDGITVAEAGKLWGVLHQQTVLEPAAGHRFFVSYPLLPWFGVITIGYAFGRVMLMDEQRRRRILLWLGLGMTAAFVLVRFVNRYGDPAPWSTQPTRSMSIASFLDCTKYPPSLLYLLMTLGPACLALRALETDSRAWILRALALFGRVPLFFYVAHLYLLRWASLPLGFARWGKAAITMPPKGPAGSPEYALWVTYLAWALAIALLYPACRWFAGVKQRSKSRIVAYL